MSPLFFPASPLLLPQSAMPADSRASGILHGLAEGPEGVGKELVEHCQEMMKGQYYGGPLVDCAVNAVFAALVWNSQDCREELESLGVWVWVPRGLVGMCGWMGVVGGWVAGYVCGWMCGWLGRWGCGETIHYPSLG